MDSTSARDAAMRPRAASDRVRFAPSAMAPICRQDSGLSSVGMRAPALEIGAIALQDHAHVAGIAHRAGLAQHYSHVGNGKLLENEHGDALTQGFHQVKTRLLDKR